MEGMNMTEYTPGPWKKSEQEDVIYAPDGSDVLSSYRSQKEIAANLRLMESSVELYEALNDLLNCISATRGSDAYNAQLAAIAALNKVEGKNV
jgi:hypothetical protein